MLGCFSVPSPTDEHLVLDDAGSLSDVVAGETRIKVLDAIVVEGIFGFQMYDGAVAELGHLENHGAPAVPLAHVLYGVAIADNMSSLAVYHPLQSIAEESLVVVQHDGLYELWFLCQRDALYQTDILHALVTLSGAL